MTTENHIESFKLLDESNSNNSESETTNYVRIPRRKLKTKRKSRLDNTPKNRAKEICTFFAFIKILGIIIAVISYGVLGYLVFNLYEKIDHLAMQLQNMESSSKKFPEEFHSIHLQLKNLEDSNVLIKENITNVSTEIRTLTRQVQNLLSTTDSLSKSIAAAPQIEALPKKVSLLEKSVASLGSRLTTLETTVQEIREKSGDDDKHYLQSIQDIKFQIATLQNKSKLLGDNFDQLQIVCNNNSKFSQSTYETFQDELKQLVSSVYDNSSLNSCILCNSSVQVKITEHLDNLTKLYHALLIRFLEYQNESDSNLNNNLVNMKVVKALESSINQSLEKLKESNSLQLETLQKDTELLKQQVLYLQDEISVQPARSSNSSIDDEGTSFPNPMLENITTTME